MGQNNSASAALAGDGRLFTPMLVMLTMANAGIPKLLQGHTGNRHARPGAQGADADRPRHSWLRASFPCICRSA
jgi:hypothetical protein